MLPVTQSLINLCNGENNVPVSRTPATNVEEATSLNKGTTINLKWKEESTNLNNGNIGLTTEINKLEDLVPATQSLINLCNGENNVPVSWTPATNVEEATSLNKGTTMMTTGKNLVLGPASSVQSPKNQCNGDNNEETRRISTRNKKAPITLSNDFLL